MSINLILVKCSFSKVYALCISNGYCIRLIKSLVLIWSLKVDVVLVMCGLHWWSLLTLYLWVLNNIVASFLSYGT